MSITVIEKCLNTAYDFTENLRANAEKLQLRTLRLRPSRVPQSRNTDVVLNPQSYALLFIGTEARPKRFSQTQYELPPPRFSDLSHGVPKLFEKIPPQITFQEISPQILQIVLEIFSSGCLLTASLLK